MRPAKVIKVFYMIAAILVIAGTFLPFVRMYYGITNTGINLFGGFDFSSNWLGKAICILAFISLVIMFVRYTRVLTFLSTALTVGCVIVAWAQWRDKVVAAVPVEPVVATYTKDYGYYMLTGGAIMMLLFAILCFLFVEED